MRIFNFQFSNFKFKSMVFVLVAFFVISPLSCRAFSFGEIFEEFEEWISGGEGFSTSTNDSQIINEINVSTNTGENIINGEVREGETKTEIYVKNIINGKEIEPIEIETEKENVEAKSKIEVSEEKAYVHQEIQLDSEKTIKDYQVDLKNSGSDRGDFEEDKKDEREDLEGREKSKVFQEWWIGFFQSLKSFFQKLFSIF